MWVLILLGKILLWLLIIFFVLVLFAALTSAISLMETNVSILRDKLGWERKKSTIVVTVYVLIIGAIVSLGFGPLSFITIIGLGLLDFFDFISNNIMMPIVALILSIFVGYVVKPKVVIDEVESSGKFRTKQMFVVVIKYIVPVCMAIILISSIIGYV